jgi:hypothetical protein
MEDIFNQVLSEEFEGHVHRFRTDSGEPWPEKQRPSLSWFTKRIKDTWPKVVEPSTEDPVVKPWDENWGDDPVRVRVLSVLFDLASDICQRRGLTEAGFEGFPNHVCDWACKLSGFFDLQLRSEGVVLLHFAYVFAADEQYTNTFGPPMTFQDESSKMLMRWHKRHQEPGLTDKLRESEGVVVIPLWEQEDWSVAEDVVARHLMPGAWVLPPIVLEPEQPVTDQGPTPREQSSDLAPNKLLEELRAQGLPIDEDHASLGMVYTNPPEQEDEEND